MLTDNEVLEANLRHLTAILQNADAERKCAECWNVTVTKLYDCGSMFGDKELCDSCHAMYYANRHQIAREQQ